MRFPKHCDDHDAAENNQNDQRGYFMHVQARKYYCMKEERERV